jgi:hypothetical protein
MVKCFSLLWTALHFNLQKTVLTNMKTYIQARNLKLFCLWTLWNVSISISIARNLCYMIVLQWPAESLGILETIPAYGQQQSGGHLCWTAQVNTAVHLVWALFCYIRPILGSLPAYTCSNRSGATAAVLRPLHSWRSAWRGRETSECAVLLNTMLKLSSCSLSQCSAKYIVVF